MTFVLLILERLYLTQHVTWLEEHVDYMSLQARALACSEACPLRPR